MAPSPANSHGNGYPLGLAGAVLATRFVGGTATVAPTTGTFEIGDFVIGRNATLFVCTVAGTPGTWVQVGAGGSGTVTSVTAADASIVVAGTAADPTIAAGALNAIANAHATAADVSLNSHKLTNVTDPAAAQDAATKSYVDAAISGLEWKQACDLGTIAALPANVYANGASGVGATLTGAALGALSVDGTAVTVGQRLLVKNEASGLKNGIYTVTVAGSAGVVYVLTRATDYDTTVEVQAGDVVTVTAGGTIADTTWLMSTTGAITIGTTALTFTQFGAVVSVTAADGSIVVAGTASAPTVRTGTLDAVATAHPPTAAVALNAQKITGLANGAAAQDAAAFNQIKSRDELRLNAMNIKGWNEQPYAGFAAIQPSSQAVYGMLQGFHAGDVITLVMPFVMQAGTSTAPTGIYVGVYSTAGVRLALSNNLAASAIWTTGQQYAEAALSAPYTVLTDGGLYLCVLVNGGYAGTALTLARMQNNSYFSQFPSGGVSGCVIQTGQATLPAPATFTADPTNLFCAWN